MTNSYQQVKPCNITSDIALRLHENFVITKLEIIDETDSHKKHKHYNPGKFHLKLVIESVQLSDIPILQAHRQIHKALADFLQNNIHALSIKIVK